jgi:hypothetical protein
MDDDRSSRSLLLGASRAMSVYMGADHHRGRDDERRGEQD